MKREIKFRAWDKSRTAYRTQQNLLDDICRFHREDGSYFDVNLWRFLMLVSQQDNFVLEQYTGLKDKNGREIYEGDIVRVWRPTETPKRNFDGSLQEDFWFDKIEIAEIKWLHCGFVDDFSRIRYDDVQTMMGTSHRYEVIGNIHENPNLL